MAQAFIPTNIDVQFGPTKEYPGGRVVSLKRGMVELDDDVAAHPIIANLVTQSPTQTARNEKMAQANVARDEAIAKANNDYAEAIAAVEKEAQEEAQKAGEEWAKKAADAAAKGESFNEPNPDPDVAHAIAMTSQPIGAVAAGAMQSKTPPLTEAQGTSRGADNGERHGRHRERP